MIIHQGTHLTSADFDSPILGKHSLSTCKAIRLGAVMVSILKQRNVSQNCSIYNIQYVILAVIS